MSAWTRRTPQVRPGHGTRTASTNLTSPNRRGTSTLGSSGKCVTAMVAVLVGIAGLFFMLATAGAPIAIAEPDATKALVEFTPDGKLTDRRAMMVKFSH